jgi:hypothetical protein
MNEGSQQSRFLSKHLRVVAAQLADAVAHAPARWPETTEVEKQRWLRAGNTEGYERYVAALGAELSLADLRS